jgi:hypothetical protein
VKNDSTLPGAAFLTVNRTRSSIACTSGENAATYSSMLFGAVRPGAVRVTLSCDIRRSLSLSGSELSVCDVEYCATHTCFGSHALFDATNTISPTHQAHCVSDVITRQKPKDREGEWALRKLRSATRRGRVECIELDQTIEKATDK